MLIEKLTKELDNLKDCAVEIAMWLSEGDSTLKAVFVYDNFGYEIDEDGLTLLDKCECESMVYIPLNEIKEIWNISDDGFSILGKYVNIVVCTFNN